jgi:hypothetical protein
MLSKKMPFNYLTATVSGPQPRTRSQVACHNRKERP